MTKESSAKSQETKSTEAKIVEPEPIHAPKRLYRSRTDRMIAGVAGGMAEYFGIDSTLMRFIFILLILLPGVGVIAYLIAWAIIPEEPESKTVGAAAKHEKTVAPGQTDKTIQRTFGFVLVLLGAFFLLHSLTDFIHMGKLWPLILVLVGVAIIFGKIGGKK